MPEEYTKDQLWQLYENLPQELRRAVFSEETADNIDKICGKNGIKDDKVISEVAKYTGYVLLGVLLPAEFQNTLKQKAGLKNGAAKQVALEITRFVFFPVRDSLEKLYQVEIAPLAGEAIKPKSEPPEITRKGTSSPGKKPEKPKGHDKYKEPIE